MRLLCAAALSLSVGIIFAYAQDKKPAEQPADARAAKLEAAKKKFDATMKELTERFQKADPADKRGVQADMREETMLMAGKVLKIAEENPKDAVAFDAAAYVLQSAGKVGAGGADVEKAVALIAEHHATNAKVKDFLIPAMRMGPSGEKLLKAVGEAATDKETKGTALFLRGYMLAQQVDDEEDEKKLATLVKQATELMAEAKKLAPAAKIGAGTIESFATKEIEGLSAVTSLGVGKPAPEVESLTLDGKKVKLSDYKGKVVLLDIWATWCGPCRAMIPHERDMVKKLKDKPFLLVSVSADDKKETLTEFLEKEAMPWTHWWDNGPASAVLKKYRVKAFPTLFLIDHNGVIKEKWVGNPGNDKLDKAVEDAVQAAIKAKG
jgi:thiol-disulfide isomerase/thioredoxin